MHTLNRGLQYLGLQLPSFTSSDPTYIFIQYCTSTIIHHTLDCCAYYQGQRRRRRSNREDRVITYNRDREKQHKRNRRYRTATRESSSLIADQTTNTRVRTLCGCVTFVRYHFYAFLSLSTSSERRGLIYNVKANTCLQ